MDKTEKSKEQMIKELEWYSKRYGPYVEKRGLHNWRNLFRKPTIQEWLILLMLLMGLFGAWAYGRDIELCRETIEICSAYFNASQPFG